MAPPKKKRNSDRNSDLKLVTPKHGRGALLARGKLGNKGGGRIPSAIRELCRVSFAERLDVLTDIADDTEAKAIDRLRAIDLPGTFGGVAALPFTPDAQPAAGDRPSAASGKAYLPGGALAAVPPSGTGYQVSLFGLVGVLAAVEEGLEINLLGLSFGIDPLDLALKLPMAGRISFREN